MVRKRIAIYRLSIKISAVMDFVTELTNWNMQIVRDIGEGRAHWFAQMDVLMGIDMSWIVA